MGHIDIAELFEHSNLEIITGMIVPMVSRDRLVFIKATHWLIILGKEKETGMLFTTLWQADKDGKCFRESYELIAKNLAKENMYEVYDNWVAHFITTPFNS